MTTESTRSLDSSGIGFGHEKEGCLERRGYVGDPDEKCLQRQSVEDSV